MYGCEYGCKECWVPKNCAKLWCWGRLVRVPWTARGSNQSILKEINPHYSLEELILKLKLQYFGHLMRRANSLENTLMLGKTESSRRRWWQRMRCLDGYHQFNGHEFEQTPGNGKGQGSLVCHSSLGSQRVRHDLATEKQQYSQWRGHLIESTNSNANFIQKHPQTHPESFFIWTPHGQSSWHVKLTITISNI